MRPVAWRICVLQCLNPAVSVGRRAAEVADKRRLTIEEAGELTPAQGAPSKGQAGSEQLAAAAAPQRYTGFFQGGGAQA